MGLRTCLAACAAAMACACGASANAGVIYSSLPDLSAAPSSDLDASYPVDVAGLFSFSDTETIRGVQFVTDASTDLSWFGVALFSDNGGQFGTEQLGAGIASQYISSTPLGHGDELVTVVLSRISLDAGSYWIQIGGSTAGIAGFSGPGSMLQCYSYDSDCQSTGQTMGFNLLGEAGGELPGIPEPLTWMLMLLGLFGLGTALRLRPASAAAAVP